MPYGTLPPSLRAILDDALANLSDDLLVIRAALLNAEETMTALAGQIDALDAEIRAAR